MPTAQRGQCNRQKPFRCRFATQSQKSIYIPYVASAVLSENMGQSHTGSPAWVGSHGRPANGFGTVLGQFTFPDRFGC